MLSVSLNIGRKLCGNVFLYKKNKNFHKRLESRRQRAYERKKSGVFEWYKRLKWQQMVLYPLGDKVYLNFCDRNQYMFPHIPGKVAFYITLRWSNGLVCSISITTICCFLQDNTHRLTAQAPHSPNMSAFFSLACDKKKVERSLVTWRWMKWRFVSIIYKVSSCSLLPSRRWISSGSCGRRPGNAPWPAAWKGNWM